MTADFRARPASAHTFIVHVEDKPGVLNRVVSLFRRRSYNIDSLTVGRTEKPGISRITLVARTDEGSARRLEASLYKLVDVLEVHDVTWAPAVVRELVFLKIDARHRAEVMQLCEVFRARIVDVGPGAITVESTGSQEKIDGLIEALRPLGIVELVRTGAVAITRGAPALKSPPATEDAEDTDDALAEVTPAAATHPATHPATHSAATHPTHSELPTLSPSPAATEA